MPGNWVIGSLLSNVWTEKEDDGMRDINLFTWQYFINYNIPDSGGLYLTSAPILTANWEADSDKSLDHSFRRGHRQDIQDRQSAAEWTGFSLLQRGKTGIWA